MSDVEDRCRLVLVLPLLGQPADAARLVGDALKGGDVASIIIPQWGLPEHDFQDLCEALVPVIQKAGVASMVAGDSRVAGRSRADGIHVSGGLVDLAEAVEKHAPKMMVGGGNAKDRHTALELGETQPDYIFFGHLEGDIKPEAHPRNLDLGEWWASMIEIPCVVMGGTDPASALEVAMTGSDFVALRQAVFAEPERAAMVIAEINAMLDEKAPRFQG